MDRMVSGAAACLTNVGPASSCFKLPGVVSVWCDSMILFSSIIQRTIISTATKHTIHVMWYSMVSNYGQTPRKYNYPP